LVNIDLQDGGDPNFGKSVSGNLGTFGKKGAGPSGEFPVKKVYKGSPPQ